MADIFVESADFSTAPADMPDIPGTRKFTEEHKDHVEKWAKKIKPMVHEHDAGGSMKVYHFTNKADHYTQSYPWDAKNKKPAKDLEEVARIWTLHTWAYYGFFKPTLAEVLLQIPENLLEQVDYFVVIGPETSSDLNKTMPYIDRGYHVAQTILYRKTKKGKK